MNLTIYNNEIDVNRPTDVIVDCIASYDRYLCKNRYSASTEILNSKSSVNSFIN